MEGAAAHRELVQAAALLSSLPRALFSLGVDTAMNAVAVCHRLGFNPVRHEEVEVQQMFTPCELPRVQETLLCMPVGVQDRKSVV